MAVAHTPKDDPFTENRREEDAGAAFVLQSKGAKTGPPFLSFFCFSLYSYIYICRRMVACGFPFDDGDRGTHHSDVALCFQRVGMGIGVLVLNGDGCRHLLLLLPHVQSA